MNTPVSFRSPWPAGRVVGANDEPAVVARARSGDRAAFATLHAKYVNMVHAVVLAHASPGDAGDLVQEVFTRALTHITTLRSDETAGPWLAGIARNVARDSVRSRRPRADLPEEIPAFTPDKSAMDDAREILEAMKTLPDTYRETLAMRLVEGMTGPEIAGRTGMTPGSVRVHLHRGMKLLHDELSRRGLLQ